MASFDVKSLFTNIPIIETCKLILDKFVPESDSKHSGIHKSQFRNTLNNCTQQLIPIQWQYVFTMRFTSN